jgi:hypothetical protein
MPISIYAVDPDFLGDSIDERDSANGDQTRVREKYRPHGQNLWKVTAEVQVGLVSLTRHLSRECHIPHMLTKCSGRDFRLRDSRGLFVSQTTHD